LGIPADTICIEAPSVVEHPGAPAGRGEPVVGGGAMFRGRAVDKLAPGLPTRPAGQLDTCPHEDLESPSRVHVDPLGYVHICQGISIGNMWKTPLSAIIAHYQPNEHPICGPLIKGGPAELARKYGIAPAAGYVDECHFCFLVRWALLNRFPDFLAPTQVYGLSDASESPRPDSAGSPPV
jgi:hypothetical protein